MFKMVTHFWRESQPRLFKKDLFFITTPTWLRSFFPGCVWDKKTNEKIIYLTFDDGPHPAITPFVINELEKYQAKATFFCIGDNVRKYPEVYRQVIAAGHTVGNHTMHHINGWKNTDEEYVGDISQARQLINSSLFRPPYGRIKRSQIQKLSGNTMPFSIIMWSVLAGDWIATLSPEKCFEQVKKNIYPGCIVVFHDSEKANERMAYALPKVLEHFSKLGYQFKAL